MQWIELNGQSETAGPCENDIAPEKDLVQFNVSTCDVIVRPVEIEMDIATNVVDDSNHQHYVESSLCLT